MKKILWLVICILVVCPSVLANNLCATNYELTSGWNKTLSKISGSNFIHKTILEQVLEKQLTKNFIGKFDVKIKSFSTPDLKEGKFKELSAIGENVIIDKLEVSKISINSLCPYNQIQKIDNKTYQFKENFPAQAIIELSADNLNKITQTTDYKRTLKELNKTMRGFLKIEDIKFEISENKLWYNLILTTPFSPKKQAIRIGTTPNFTGEDIAISNSVTSSKTTILSILNLSDALNFINPLDFSLEILENNVVDAQLQELYIRDNKIVLNSLVIIRK